jgi:hypothetical protein
LRSHWRDCIVTLIDFVGIRSQAGNSIASTQMRKLHRALLNEVDTGRYWFYHAYTYNASVLILAHVGRTTSSYETAWTRKYWYEPIGPV